MDIGKAFTFIFEDPDWLRKVAIGTGLMLVSLILSVVLIGLVPLIIVIGYTVLVVRNVMDGMERPLPEWDDWGGLFIRGLKLFLIQLIWALPLIFVSLGSGLPPMLAGDNPDVQGVATAISVCCSCLTVLLSIAYALVEPVLTFRFARTGEFASGFEFGEIFRLLGENIVNILIAVIVAAVAGVILFLVGGFAGTILLVIGLLVTVPAAAFLSELIGAHLIGQVGREAESRVATSS